MQKGDTVRYLNAVGGGKITRIDGKIAYVEEDGFETPMLVSELVVVLPAGHGKPDNSARLMFDQSAVDAVKARDHEQRAGAVLTKEVKAEPAPELPVEETAHGEKISLVLAFEPVDAKRLSQTSFAAVLVNDSNYYMSLAFLTCGASAPGWTLAYEGTLEPNMVLDLATFTHEELPSLEKVALQCVAFKMGKEFAIKAPVSVQRKLDLTKFYKLHCFRPGKYFDSPVLEIPLVTDDVPCQSLEAPLAQLAEAYGAGTSEPVKNSPARKKKQGRKDNPHVLLPLQEVDLHIGELLDSTSGLDNSAMMQVQLDAVRKEMNRHALRVGQKIVFIHGKGDGVLRQAVRNLLKKEYPKAELQDASFREYGFGATLVTIH